MAFLTILGVTIPVANESAARVPERIGDVDADGPGSPAFVQRGTRRRWEITTPPVTQEDADRFANLIEGVYHRWSFARGNLRSDTGVTPTMGYRQFRILDNGIEPVSTDFHLAFDVQVPRDWLIVFRTSEDSPVWAIRSDGQTFDTGTPSGGGDLGALGTNLRPTVDEDGFLILRSADAFGGNAIEELILFPYWVPDEWIASIGSAAQSWAHDPAPVVEAAGDFIEEDSVRVVGRVDTYDHTQGYRDGDWRPSLREVSIVLVEESERLYAPIPTTTTYDDRLAEIEPPSSSELVFWVDADNVDGMFNETLADGDAFIQIANLARYTAARNGNSWFFDHGFFFTGTNQPVYRSSGGGLDGGSWIDVPSLCWLDTPLRGFGVTQPALAAAVFHDVGNNDVRVIGGTVDPNRWVLYRQSGNAQMFVPGGTIIGPATTSNRWHYFSGLFNGASSTIEADDLTPVNGTVGGGTSLSWRLGARWDNAFANSQRWKFLAVWRGDGTLPTQAAIKSYVNARFGSGWPKV